MKLLEKQKVLVVIGPTAVGKTKLSIELAKRYNGEIISGDSMQVYKTLDIGTAKITKEEMDGVVHHLIDIKEPTEEFSVAEFQKLVREKIDEITRRGKLPIIAGGTGLYINAVLQDYQFAESEKDMELRASLEQLASEIGGEQLHQKLVELDPKTAETIHPNNTRRVIRALEVYYTTDQTVSEIQSKQKEENLYNSLIIGLTMDRELLYSRINQRVDLMMEQGLLEEVKGLFEQQIYSQAVRGIGYKEIYDYLEGKATLEEAVEQVKQNSRRYAKRQLTWFRNKMDVEWFDLTTSVLQSTDTKVFEEIFGTIEEKLQVKSNS